MTQASAIPILRRHARLLSPIAFAGALLLVATALWLARGLELEVGEGDAHVRALAIATRVESAIREAELRGLSAGVPVHGAEVAAGPGTATSAHLVAGHRVELRVAEGASPWAEGVEFRRFAGPQAADAAEPRTYRIQGDALRQSLEGPPGLVDGVAALVSPARRVLAAPPAPGVPLDWLADAACDAPARDAFAAFSGWLAAPPGGQRTYLVREPVPGFPVFVATATTEGAMLTRWHTALVASAVALALIGLLCLLTHRVVMRAVADQDALHAALRASKEAAVASERQYRHLFENLQLGFALHEVVLDADGKPVDYIFLAANPAYREVTGVDALSNLHRRVSEVYASVSSDTTDWIGLFGKVATDGETLRLDAYAEGLDRWFDVLAYQPEPGKFAVLVGDITGRKATEVALQRESAANLKMIRGASDGVHVLDLDGNLIEASDSFLSMLGYRRADLIGANVTRWDPDAAPELADGVLAGMYASGSRVQFDRTHMRRDGSRFPVEITGFPLELDGERRVYFSARDISERLAMTEELVKRERYQRVLIDNFPFPVWLKDGARRLLDVNQAYLSACGRSDLGDVIGSTDAQLWPNGMAEVSRLGDEQAIQTGQTVVEERELELHGERRWFETYKSAVRLDERLLGTVGYSRDITARKAREQELEQYRSHLEDLVRRRTEDLARATRAAEDGNRAKSTFLTTMSHELRTPLHAILSNAELARRAKTGEKLEERLSRIDQAGRHLQRIVENILDFSRIESGRVHVAPERFSVGDLVAWLENLFGDKIRAKGLALRVQTPPELEGRPLLGDVQHLRQVLANLVGNAVKFTDTGWVAFACRLLGETAEAVEVAFDVSDSGIGFEPAAAERIFEPFVQEEGAETRKYGGSGLGLAISQRLVEAMGGRIVARGAPGAGCTFSFALHFARAPKGDGRHAPPVSGFPRD
ncbi:MAG: PAS domain S-box protein [Rhodocyclaceae bacterium]|nr:PAS domain S-box protein [Rhodocyclaceae bacterium]